ncbi:major capsid protein [Gluconobacter oxydans]|uniref:major capsid protein n=1 Tax=Gluconobacter oxydans TaxID=442 RepID=UPI0039E9E9DF
MAINTSTVATLADWAARRDPSGKTADTVNLLSQTNEILDDMLWKEGNLPTGNRTTVQTGIPTATWRMLNYGVPLGKSTTAQVDDTCGILELYNQIDKDLEGSKNP